MAYNASAGEFSMYMHYGRVGAMPTQRIYRLSDIVAHFNCTTLDTQVQI